MPKAKSTRKAEPEIRPEVTAKNMKAQLGRLLSRVGFGNERIIITRNGEKIAALISIADFEKLNAA
jgi:prevent-host-death family protein